MREREHENQDQGERPAEAPKPRVFGSIHAQGRTARKAIQDQAGKNAPRNETDGAEVRRSMTPLERFFFRKRIFATNLFEMISFVLIVTFVDPLVFLWGFPILLIIFSISALMGDIIEEDEKWK